MPACSAAPAGVLQSLFEAHSPEPQPSHLLHRATTTFSHYIRKGRTPNSIPQCLALPAPRRNRTFPFPLCLTPHPAASLSAARSPSYL